jgi:YbbR domain-containing protein
MKRAFKWIAALLFENLAWKLLALAVAVLIWALVATEPELSTFTTVRLEYKNLPDDLEISSDPVTSVVLELRGPSGELRGIGETLRPAVVLDMTTVQPGQRTFMIGDGNVKLARGVSLVRSIPSEARFTFEERASRSVPVQARFTGEGRNGYMVAHYDLSPRRVLLTGPKSRVAQIGAAITDLVDVSSVVGSSEFRVNAFVDDPFVRFATSPLVAVVVTMKKIREADTLKKAPEEGAMKKN